MKQFQLMMACSALLAMIACSETSDQGSRDASNDVTFEEVQAQPFRAPDHGIRYGDEALLHGLLWLPDTPPPGGAPLLVMIHGGCWLNAYGVAHVRAFSSALADVGYAVWSLEYRRTGDEGGGWPGSLEDVTTALTIAPELFARHPVDFSRMVIAGHSAGGHLALLAGGRQPGLQAVIGLAAITDIVRYAEGDNSCQQATEPFMGGPFTDNKDRYRAANPAEQARHDRTILLHGTADALVPVDHANLPGAETVLVEQAGHFDWVHPGTPAFRQLTKTLAEVFAE